MCVIVYVFTYVREKIYVFVPSVSIFVCRVCLQVRVWI